LRLTALNAAEIQHDRDLTFDICSTNLVTTGKDGSIEQMGQNEREILARSALSMATFAELSRRIDAPAVIAREARDIPGLSSELACANLRSLMDEHADEWQRLLAAVPKGAWLARQFLNQ
jgi:hypothetical protein